MSEPAVGSPLSMHDPRQVGPWTIHSRLGAGGMGVVFYASSPGYEGVALKVIRPGLLDAPATRDRFRREVAILRSVRDAHISEFLAADLESEPAWLAIEYVSGPTLRDEIAENGPLSEDEWWKLARGMAQALAVLDKHRITHRDLKPGNVILGEHGPELIDFGIAHPEDATSLTATGLVTGSPSWLSPEQATLEPTGPPSDIFALGSLLAYAATGRPPVRRGCVRRRPDEHRHARAGPRRHRPQPFGTAAADAGQGPHPPADRPTGPGPVAREHDGRHDPDRHAGADDRPRRDGCRCTRGAGTHSCRGDCRATDHPRSRRRAPWHPHRPSRSPARRCPVARAADQTLVAAAASTAPAAPPIRPRTAGNPRTVGPRTAAAQQRRATRRRVLVGILVGLVLLVGGWFVVQALGGDSTNSGSGSGSSTGAPPSAADAPPAPAKDQLKDGDWLLATYRFDNTADGLVVSGTVRNTGDATASANLTTWVYLGDESLGSVATTVTDVPAGGSVPVTMTGDAVWKKGQKVVLLQAS